MDDPKSHIFRNSKFKIQKRSDLRCFWTNEEGQGGRKNHQIHICGFHCVYKHIEGQLNICTSFVIHSHNWLNLHMDDCPIGYKQKFWEKTSELVKTTS